MNSWLATSLSIADSQKRVGFLRGLLKTCREAASAEPATNSIAENEIIANWDESEFISAFTEFAPGTVRTSRHAKRTKLHQLLLDCLANMSSVISIEFRITEGRTGVQSAGNESCIEIVCRTMAVSHWIGAEADGVARTKQLWLAGAWLLGKYAKDQIQVGMSLEQQRIESALDFTVLGASIENVECVTKKKGGAVV